jgi:hypothetical protein
MSNIYGSETQNKEFGIARLPQTIGNKLPTTAA